MRQPPPTVGRHHYKVGLQTFCSLKNLAGRIANRNFDFVTDFVGDSNAGQLLEPGSRGGLHLTKG